MADKGDVSINSSETVIFHVSGQTFNVSRTALDKGPFSKLKQLASHPTSTHGHDDVIRVERPADTFGAILAFCQTGQLHIPATSCPSAFLCEMAYWEIPIEQLSECCHIRLQCFLEEQRTLAKFKSHLHKLDDLTQSKFSFSFLPCLNKVRAALWVILDCRGKSLLARIYFAASVIMVFLSIFAVSYGTDRQFQRPMTNCERLDYMISSGMAEVETVKALFESACNEDEPPGVGGPPQTIQFDMPFLEPPSRKNDYPEDDFIEIYVPEPTPPLPAYPWTTPDGTVSPSQEFSVTDNYSSIEDDPNMFVGSSPGGKYVSVPNMKVKVWTLMALDTVTVVFFSVDLLMRLFCCPCLFRYFSSLINIADAAALVATYAHMILVGVNQHYRYEDKWVDILEYMQMLRSLRFFRIVSNVPAGRVLAYTVFSNVKDLLILIMFLVSGMCVFASVFYIAEGKLVVESIPNCWYWAVITMTTVGYGDIVPTTGIGRVIGCTCAVCGVLLFAMTVPIFANHFLTLYNYLMAQDSLDKVTAGKNKHVAFASPGPVTNGTRSGLTKSAPATIKSTGYPPTVSGNAPAMATSYVPGTVGPYTMGANITTNNTNYAPMPTTM